jgi:DNA-binding transcriptional ArsR family regulator
MEEKTAILALGALAHPLRLRLFRALVGAMPEGLTPGTLGPLLDLPPSTLSFHLKELSHAGLVDAERDGRSLIYRPQLAHMNALLAYLTAHCCEAGSGAACAPASAVACCPAPAEAVAPFARPGKPVTTAKPAKAPAASAATTPRARRTS